MGIVIGNPKAGSRTRRAAELVHQKLVGTEPQWAIEVSDIGPDLLGWGSPVVREEVARVQSTPFVVFASPTFKATYTGLLKLFLDQFAGGEGLRDVVVVPLMLGAGPIHALAPEVHLKPLLGELGAVTTSPGLYLQDSSFETDNSIETYAERWGPAVRAAVDAAERARS